MTDLVVSYNVQPKVLLAFAAEVQAALKKTAFDTEAQAKLVVPVDTGNLKASIQADVSQVAAFHTEVTVGAEYGEYVERGTWCMSAQPYFFPAIRRCGAALIQALKSLHF